MMMMVMVMMVHRVRVAVTRSQAQRIGSHQRRLIVGARGAVATAQA